MRVIAGMSEAQIQAQPPAIWHAVEQRIWAKWPMRVRDATCTAVGTPLAPGWLTPEVARYLEEVDVPVRQLFTACWIVARAAAGL